LIKSQNRIFFVTFNMLSNAFKRFLETLFLKSPLYKTLTLIIRLTWNFICMFELGEVRIAPDTWILRNWAKTKVKRYM